MFDASNLMNQAAQSPRGILSGLSNGFGYNSPLMNIPSHPVLMAQSPAQKVNGVLASPATDSKAMPALKTGRALPANEERQFQQWIKSLDWYKEFLNEYKEAPNLDIDEYDYRAAWKAGILPERDPYDGNRYHWPSSDSSGNMLKSPDHPTAWKEYFMRETGINPDALGLKNKEEGDLYLKNILLGR